MAHPQHEFTSERKGAPKEPLEFSYMYMYDTSEGKTVEQGGVLQDELEVKVELRRKLQLCTNYILYLR